MNLSVFYNPYKLIERLAVEVKKRRRLGKLKNKPGARLQLGHIDSLELVELIVGDKAIKNDAVIFDIGSNTGTWTLLAKSFMPGADIHAFEPLNVHTNTFRKSCEGLSHIHLHQFCVGNENKAGVINVSSFSDSSSILDATPLEFEQFNIKKTAEEHVEIKRLADLINNKTIPVPEILKLDIQGYELEALKGLDNWLNSVSYIICEVSFKEYYYGQPRFLDIANYLSNFKFQLWAFGDNTPVGRELDQIDVLFKRNG